MMFLMSADADRSVQARRLRRRRWTDPRTLAGIVLVAVCVVAGSQVFAAADDTTAVWALRSDVRAGATPSIQELQQVRVRLDDTTASRYVTANVSESELTDRLSASVWAHDADAGELLAAAALAPGATARAAELPLRVEPGAMPADTTAGEVVDVWVSPDARDPTSGAAATRVLRAVPVLSVQPTGSALAEGSTQIVLVGVDRATADSLDEVLAATGTGQVTLVRVTARRLT